MDKAIKMCAAPDCNKPAYEGKRKYCSTHGSRLQKHGNFDPPIRPTQEERFWSKVQKTDTCWIWTAAKSPLGYGSFGVESGKIMPAHRYAYELLVGPIPKGLTIDHLCRNPSCVNPAHLEPVTQGENVKRSTFHKAGTAVNLSKTHCPHGHPYSGDNVYFYHGSRHCIACMRKRTREQRAKSKMSNIGQVEQYLTNSGATKIWVKP